MLNSSLFSEAEDDAERQPDPARRGGASSATCSERHRTTVDASGRPPLALMVVLSLKHARSAPQLAARVVEWAGPLREMYNLPGGREALQLLVRYYLVVNQAVTTTELARQLEPAFGDQFGDIREDIMSTGQQLVEQGRRRGRQEGRRQERLELVERQLRRKFGPLPDEALRRLRAASTGKLLHWADNLLAASTLDEVFDGQGGR